MKTPTDSRKSAVLASLSAMSPNPNADLNVMQLYSGNTVSDRVKEAIGANFFRHETRELGSLSRHTLTALEDIVGVDRYGERMEAPGVSDALRAQGRVWAQHVLEAPISWIVSTVYVAGTVLSSYPGAYQSLVCC
jgi:hypothetical protein